MSARAYPAARWSPQGCKPHDEADYGRRAKVWVFGAFEPATGLATTLCAASRRSANFAALLDCVVQVWPCGELIVILDNLSIHKTLDVRLWALAHQRVRFLFQPNYAPWLNLIEPWWKTRDRRP